MIYELSDAGTTVFVTTHSMEEAERCHCLALMNRGRMIALDTPGRIREGLGHPLLEVRTAEAPRAVDALDGAPGVLSVGLYGRTVHALVEEAAAGRRAVREALEGAGIAVEGIEEVTPSLEDAFIARIEEAGGAPAD